MVELNMFDFVEFVFGFFVIDVVDGEVIFGVVDEMEVFVSFFDVDDVYEVGGVGYVGVDFVVNFD